jgi:hypothetical protein
MGPIKVAGACAGDQPSDLLLGDWAIFDTALKVTSGDMVMIEILVPPAHGFGFRWAAKQLEAIGGAWWLASFDGLNPLNQRHRLCGRLVCTIHFPRRSLKDGALLRAHEAAITPPDGYRERMLRATAPALAQLVKCGFDRRTVFREALLS